MTSYSELSSDWCSLFQQQDPDQWSHTDLQLAAELGKTLLERNKELEILLKEQKINSDEQEREIVHLRKQINAMSEVNDSRLKVYEQLEVGIQDLERNNHRLTLDKTRDKKQIKSLTSTIETLETRCEELNRQLEEVRETLSLERRKNERLIQEHNGKERFNSTPSLQPTNIGMSYDRMSYDGNATTSPENGHLDIERQRKANSTGLNETGLQYDSSMILSGLSFNDVGPAAGVDNEELLKLINDLESTKRAYLAEQQRCGELEEQLVVIIQENQTLQTRVAQTSANEEMMSMHDEFSLLDDVRQGQMCSRCLGAVDDRATNNDDQSSVAPTEEMDEEDERSLLGVDSQRDCDKASELSSAGGYHTGFSIKIGPSAPNSLDLTLPGSPNPYRDLVDKYEALLEVQRSSIVRKNNVVSPTGANDGGNGDLTLAEEIKKQANGEINQTQNFILQAAAAVENAQSSKDTAANTSDSKGTLAAPGGRTPTEFSEAETSSSGFLEETSNKCTQTDERPGFFLCSIGDGEDCKFSIYDDASPIDSHFRNRPEYRDLFKEIFAVLKKAAENKEEGDKLPLLDDEVQEQQNETNQTVAKVPPVTPANEELPVDFSDDTHSIISSAVSEQSIAMSECITKLERKTAKKHINECRNQENKQPMPATAVGALQQSTSALSSGTAGGIGVKQIVENGRVLTPFKREPLEYLTVGVGIKKKNRRKNRGLQSSGERVESPLASPRVLACGGSAGSSSGRRTRKDFVPLPAEMLTPESGRGKSRMSRNQASGGSSSNWSGSPMIIYNRNLTNAHALRARQFELNGVEYQTHTVSQELSKLKKLDLSYAEVLRRTESCEHQHQQLRNMRQHQRRRNGNNINNNHYNH